MSAALHLAETLVGRYPACTVHTRRGVVTYREAGAGSAVILLHGIGSQSGSWVFQLDGLAADFHLVAWDAPGYGGSDKLTGTAPDAGDYAETLAAFLDALRLARVTLVASSLGALIAGAFADRWPQAVAGLVLLNPAGGYARAPAAVREEKLTARLDRLARLGPLGMAQAPSPGMLSDAASEQAHALAAWSTAQIRPDGYRQAAHMLAGGRLVEGAARFAGPVAVVAGSVDTVTPPAACEAIARAFPCATFQLLPGIGHLSYLDAPTTVNDLVAAFARAQFQRAVT
jgi:pimeloyl-ACP methyl ester carboxylesterase